MFLTYLMLFVALCLSAVAAFYSIVGLTAIFAAAVIPIIIMGSILEVAKLVVTVWLHEYWRQAKLAMKVYLVPAVGILMVITSMGIFGFLSKAHLDQAVPAGDVSAQVAIFDDKIKTQRDNIEAARTALRQLDAAVDQQMARSTDEQGAQRAANLRRQQGAERNRLNQDISRAQAEIVKLQEQRAPIAAQARKVEAEVGPIKYIAALIYGDNPDTNLLEKAVRWVIIILVTVFDPLAIFMLLAATESYKWEKYRGKGGPKDGDEPPPKQSTYQAMSRVRAWSEGLWSRVKRNKDDAVIPTDESNAENLAQRSPRDNMDVKSLAAVVEPTDPGISDSRSSVATDTPRIAYKILGDADDETPVSVIHLPDQSQDEDASADAEVVKHAKRLWKEDHPDSTLKEQRSLFEQGKIPYEPWEDYLRDPRIQHEVGFGTEFPERPYKTQMFVRTDHLPTTLHKWNGEKWIEVDKTKTDSYTYNDEYISALITKISSGQYDPELLTEAERVQIEDQLKQNI